MHSFIVIRVRKAEERKQKEAELRRLKNLKREEITKRLQAIQAMSGGALIDDGLLTSNQGEYSEGVAYGQAGKQQGLGETLIEGDFDPEK